MQHLLGRSTGRSYVALLVVFTLLIFVVGCGDAAPATQVVQPAATTAPKEPTIASPKATAEPTQAPVSTPVEVGPAPATATTPDENDTYEGMPVGFTDQGLPYIGPPDAPVTIEEFSDYLCPYCIRHVEQTLPTLKEKFVKTGQVRLVFRHMPIASLHPKAPEAHQAAFCAGEQGAAYYWPMHYQLFASGSEWGRLSDPGEYLAGVAEETGVDIAAYAACVDSDRPAAAIQASIAAAQGYGLRSTPSFRFILEATGEDYNLIGAQPIAKFEQYIEAMVAGDPPPQDEQAEAKPPELPYWASTDGLAPDPERPGFTMAGDPYRGSTDAEAVVVEFSNFQCPACKTHALEIQPTLDESLVDTGEVMWVFKNLPFSSNPQAPAAAVAAECAGDQAEFWEMHDLLFESEDTWAVDEPDAPLIALAGQLGLDTADFAQCLGSRQAMERILADVYDAQGVVNSTPSFIILHGGRGGILQGGRSAEQFESTLRGMIESTDG